MRGERRRPKIKEHVVDQSHQQPHHHPTNTGFRIDTWGAPNDAYTLRSVGRVAEVSRNLARFVRNAKSKTPN